MVITKLPPASQLKCITVDAFIASLPVDELNEDDLATALVYLSSKADQDALLTSLNKTETFFELLYNEATSFPTSVVFIPDTVKGERVVRTVNIAH